ncbi:hypothetical protein PZH42_30460, partial [Bacteroides cellulosilyticus]
LCMIGNLKKWKEGTLKREMTVKEQPITLTATRGECHGTTVEYCQAYQGSDDGFEFFGGSVRFKDEQLEAAMKYGNA